MTKAFVAKIRKHKDYNQAWNTPGGTLTTTETVRAQFTLPELQDDKLIEWNLHVTNTLGANGMIIGRDLLEFLQIDLCFSDQMVQWGERSIPFKEADASVQEAYQIYEEGPLTHASDRIKQILDAKYKPADLDEVMR